MSSPVADGSDFSTAARIKDFSQADGDLIDVTRISIGSGLPPGSPILECDDPFLQGGAKSSQAAPGAPGIESSYGFNFIGTHAFTGSAGEYRYEKVYGRTMLYGDTDGDGNADVAIAFAGRIDFVESDFVTPFVGESNFVSGF